MTDVFLRLQIAWSVELAYGSVCLSVVLFVRLLMLSFEPYLLSLGISKSLLAFVWAAGPLSGTIVQPYVGIKSDNCRVRWGRRKPFMLGGALATVFSLLALAWTKEIIGGLLHLFGVPRDDPAVRTVAIVFAVILIYVLDFAINVSKLLMWVAITMYSILNLNSSSSISSFHRRLHAHSSARKCQCLGEPY